MGKRQNPQRREFFFEMKRRNYKERALPMKRGVLSGLRGYFSTRLPYRSKVAGATDLSQRTKVKEREMGKRC